MTLSRLPKRLTPLRKAYNEALSELVRPNPDWSALSVAVGTTQAEIRESATRDKTPLLLSVLACQLTAKLGERLDRLEQRQSSKR